MKLSLEFKVEMQQTNSPLFITFPFNMPYSSNKLSVQGAFAHLFNNLSKVDPWNCSL